MCDEWYAVFCDWVLPLSITLLRFTHIVACLSIGLAKKFIWIFVNILQKTQTNVLVNPILYVFLLPNSIPLSDSHFIYPFISQRTFELFLLFV